MMTKQNIRLFYSLCIIFLSFFTACHSGHKTTAKTSHKPKFIDDVYFDGHNKNNVKVNGIQNSENKTTYTDNKNSDNIPKPQPEIKPSVIKSLKTKYADILGVSTKDITNYSLYRFIDEWYGVNYHIGGTDKSGIDCSGFARKLFTEVYGMDLERTACDQFNNCAHIKDVKKASEGDLVFFHIRGKQVSHVGVYLKNDYFVHASTTSGVMISNLNEEYWHKYFTGAGKVVKN